MGQVTSGPTMLFPALVLARAPIAAPPRFRVARVVMPPPDEGLDTWVELADARRDGSAVGVTGGRMVNSTQTDGIYVLAGHWWSVEDFKTPSGLVAWEPYAILGPREVAVRSSTGPMFPRIEARVRTRDFHPTRLPDLASVDAGRFLKEPAREPRLELGSYTGRLPERVVFSQAWWSPHLRGTPTDRTVGVVWTTTRFGYEVGDAEIDAPTEDRADYDPRDVPMLRREGDVRPLREAVIGRPELGGLAWVSPKGWMIATIWRGDRRGLAWLERVAR